MKHTRFPRIFRPKPQLLPLLLVLSLFFSSCSLFGTDGTTVSLTNEPTGITTSAGTGQETEPPAGTTTVPVETTAPAETSSDPVSSGTTTAPEGSEDPIEEPGPSGSSTPNGTPTTTVTPTTPAPTTTRTPTPPPASPTPTVAPTVAPTPTPSPTPTEAPTVSFTIDYTQLLNSSDTVKARLEEARVWDLIPANGYEPLNAILALNPGDSVLDVSKRAFDLYRIPREIQDFGFGAYVQSIKMIEEKVAGPGSGWTYEVNGAQPPIAADSYSPGAGDRIVWKYVVPGN